MKNLLLLFFILFSISGYCQVNSVIPPEANALYNNAIRTINPAIKDLVEKNAGKLKGRRVNMDSLTKSLSHDKLFKNASQSDVEAITVLIMVQISRNADADLKSLVVNMHRSDNASPDADESSKKVETLLSAKSEIAENITLVMKRMPGVADMTLENLK
jgi:hypothetical protein